MKTGKKKKTVGKEEGDVPASVVVIIKVPIYVNEGVSKITLLFNNSNWQKIRKLCNINAKMSVWDFYKQACIHMQTKG